MAEVSEVKTDMNDVDVRLHCLRMASVNEVAVIQVLMKATAYYKFTQGNDEWVRETFFKKAD